MTKSKYMRLKTDEMNYLKKKAYKLDMVFKPPNAVLRDLLGLEEKPRRISRRKPSRAQVGGKPKKIGIEIRVDDDVAKLMKAYAKKFGMPWRPPINELLKHVSRHASRLEDGEEEQLIGLLIGQRLPARRAGGRPATR